MQKEITDYKPKIDNNSKNGQTLDTVIRDTVQPLQSVPHYKSTELGNIGQQDQAGKFQEPVEFMGRLTFIVAMVASAPNCALALIQHIRSTKRLHVCQIHGAL